MTQSIGDRVEKEEKDPVIDSLINQIKSNYMENVGIDELIEFDKSKEKSKFSKQFDKLKTNLQNINKTILVTVILTALITSVSTFGLTYFFSNSNSSTTATETSGQVALTEAELKAAVIKLNTVVYWAGPLENAKYTLTMNEAGAAFIRYLPNGEGADDTTKKYLTVATYMVNAAYDAVKAAGNEQDGIGLMTADGAAVYYNKNSASNVYMAYPGQDLQIEVFDPTPGRALQLINTTGLLQPVR